MTARLSANAPITTCWPLARNNSTIGVGCSSSSPILTWYSSATTSLSRAKSVVDVALAAGAGDLRLELRIPPDVVDVDRHAERAEDEEQ